MTKKSVECVRLFLSLLMLVAFSARSEVITFDANESPPFWSQGMVDNGMCGEIVSAIAKEAGLQTKIQFMPLKRLIDDNTNNDLGNPIFFMRNQEFSAIIPIAVYHISLFYYQPNHPQKVVVKSLKDLDGYRIGILKETLVDSTYFEKAGVTFKTSYVQDSLFKKLKLGRIDFALRIEVAANQSIERLFPDETDNFKVVEKFKMTQPIAMMISENYPNGILIGEQFKLGLETIIENGQYGKIIEKHHSKGMPDNWFDALEKFQRLYDFSD